MAKMTQTTAHPETSRKTKLAPSLKPKTGSQVRADAAFIHSLIHSSPRHPALGTGHRHEMGTSPRSQETRLKKPVKGKREIN